MDGVDLLSLGLDEVRGRIAAIPQDPVLFSGTVRRNLDPFDRHTDAELWEALRHVNMHVRSPLGSAGCCRSALRPQLIAIFTANLCRVATSHGVAPRPCIDRMAKEIKKRDLGCTCQGRHALRSCRML